MNFEGIPGGLIPEEPDDDMVTVCHFVSRKKNVKYLWKCIYECILTCNGVKEECCHTYVKWR